MEHEHHEHHEEGAHEVHHKRTSKKSTGLIFLGGIVILLVLAIVFAKDLKSAKGPKALSLTEAQTKAKLILAEISKQEKLQVDLKDITKFNDGLYLVKVTVSGKDFDSYLTVDGTKFFVQPPVETSSLLASSTATAADNQTATAPTVVPKTDKPKVELFVMSYCPYGTQIEKGIIPAVETLGSKVDFSLKFVNYAMHGDKEIAENMKQYCIAKNDGNGKLLTYLKCFLADSAKGDACVASTGINKANLDSCVKATDSQYKITATAADKTKWSNGSYPPFAIFEADNAKYSVQGSPTLIINGAESQAGRDSASLLAAMCAGFKTAPKECQAKLSTAAPAAGFGTAVDTSGSASTGAGCASPATGQ